MKISSLAQWLHNRRLLLGLTQADVAHASGIDPATINRIENGKHYPSANLCIKLAPAYAVDPVDLLRVAGWLPGVADDELPTPTDAVRRVESLLAHPLWPPPVRDMVVWVLRREAQRLQEQADGATSEGDRGEPISAK